jgi:alkylation response protein AidB-like acyl-CoA dehydrogenase
VLLAGRQPLGGDALRGLLARQVDEERFQIRREWEAGKAAAGFAGIAWPTEYGGRGGTPTMKAIYDEEMAKAGAPSSVNVLGLSFLAPTVMAVGTEEQKREIIKPLLHCETIWCQGFSEPGAGSDLAALQMRAERAGDEYVLNGQKIWTTNAMHGDKIFTLAGTSAPGRRLEARRHLDAARRHAPARGGGAPAQADDRAGGVRRGLLHRRDRAGTEVLGGEGNGWATAMLLLSFERGSSAITQYIEFRRMFDEVARLARELDRDGRPAAQDPALRQQLASRWSTWSA